MAHARVEFFSDTLGLSCSMTVILPQRTTGQIGMEGQGSNGPPRVLYLLHGLSDDDTIWLRRTSIERYAAQYGIAVVMPAVGRSFYCDEAYGGAYWTFVSQELPALVEEFFAVSTRREDTFVAGLSMGGYGAMKLALRHPDRFAGAASMSGVLDLRALMPEASWEVDPRMWQRIFDGPLHEQEDLVVLLGKADPRDLPRLWVGSGTEDRVYAGNEHFLSVARGRGIPVQTDIVQGAEHEWGLWDRQIQLVLAYFFDPA